LYAFDYFFVQNESSKKLLQSLNFNNVKTSGDTRFDRVTTILERDNTLPFIEDFIHPESTTIVIGSSWPKDEALLVKFINESNENTKFIIAPHNIKRDQITELQKSITKKTVLFTEHENKILSNYTVFIIDTIGILPKIYNYADIAYVGGGFGNPGVHNILEPATFGVPIIVGPNYSHFPEATALVHMKGCVSISNYTELSEAFSTLLNNDDIRLEQGHVCSTFVQMNKGATESVVSHILNETLK
jgi:3-deoxy-D-manno-octulosonic-acid transferase